MAATKISKTPKTTVAIARLGADERGRRNLTPEQMSELRGRRYNRVKQRRGGTGANQYTMQSGQKVPSAKTAERLAVAHGEPHNTKDTAEPPRPGWARSIVNIEIKLTLR